MTDELPGPPRPVEVEALGALSAAYAAAVDGRDGEGFAALFAPSGELLVPDVPNDLRPVLRRAGTEALRQVPEGLRRYARTLHLVSDHRFTFRGERAFGEVQCVAHHVAAATSGETDGRVGTDTVWFLRYADQYTLTTGGWRFQRRALHLQWIEEHPVTQLPADAPPSG